MRVLGLGTGFGLLAIAALASACGSSVRNHDDTRDPCVAQFGGACEPEPYPDPQPHPEPAWVTCEAATEGAPCQVPGEDCFSGDECGGTGASCGDDHQWHITIYDDECCFDECCSGPGNYGPPDAPHVGDYCDYCYDGYGCAYAIDIGCGVAQGVSLSCDPTTYTWQVDEPACELPPDACPLHATADECAADDACRWLEPGCEAPALSAPGCFAAADCLACGGGATCAQVVVDPCPGADCGSCSELAWVCQQ